jgi:hypothetical protein
MTAANPAGKPLDNARPGLTTPECRPSTRTATDDSGQPAHSYGSEGRTCKAGLPPRTPAAYGLSPPLFQPLTAYAARGRIFPAPARRSPRKPICERDAMSWCASPTSDPRGPW